MSRSSGRGARSRVPNAGGMCSQRLLFPNGPLLGLQHGFPSPVDLPFLTFSLTFHFLLLPTCECAGELTPLGRLKLKCDKKIPCGSCVRRGCTSICPNGASPACACGTVWIPVLRTRCSHALCGGGRSVCSQGAYLQDKAQGVYICCVIASHLCPSARVRLRPCFPSIGRTRRPSVDACLLEICG